MTSPVTNDGLSWPPLADEYYLPSGPHRPVMQGDVFDRVPFVKGARGNTLVDPPNMSAKLGLVAVLGYPCDMYSQGRLTKVQLVAPVRLADKLGIPENWDGAFTFAPLPDLLGDGQMYAADLRTAANIDAFYLDPAARVRSCSELGWAAFRQRIGLAGVRLLNHLDDLVSVGREVWDEMELWQRWNDTGARPADFQIWLDAPESNLGGFARRAALARGMTDVVRASLEKELRDRAQKILREPSTASPARDGSNAESPPDGGSSSQS